MRDEDIHRVVTILREDCRKWKEPAVTEVARVRRDPFSVLVSCLLSLRTKDRETRKAAERLLSVAGTPKELAALPVEEIERLIYPVGFYRTKARNLKAIARELVERYDSRVPDSLEGLLSLKGVGRKTANLVITIGYDKDGICVDTHVHRIMNRLGYVETKTPEETEFALRRKLPRQYWKEINDLLVTHGQNICRPISPLCSRCRLSPYCARKGVTRSR